MDIIELEEQKQEETQKEWKFLVSVGTSHHVVQFSVVVDKSHWKKLTRGLHTPDELVRRSFAFLLMREPRDSILQRFRLDDIKKYFPDYETQMRKEFDEEYKDGTAH